MVTKVLALGAQYSALEQAIAPLKVQSCLHSRLPLTLSRVGGVDQRDSS